MEQEVSEQAGGVVVGALALPEAEGGLEQAALLCGEPLLRDTGLFEPVGEGVGDASHRSPSRAIPERSLLRSSGK